MISLRPFLKFTFAAFAAAALSGAAQAQNAAEIKAQTQAETAAAQGGGAAEKCAPSAAKTAALRQAQSGMFRALRLSDKADYMGDLQFRDEKGEVRHIADFSGKMLLVNLWGVWCPPCRREIPDLAELQRARQSDKFAVMTIYDHASNIDKVRAFLKTSNAENLPLYHDPDGMLQTALKAKGLARGLPASLLIDGKSCLIASLNGGVPWNSADALQFINAAEKLP